MRAKNARPRIGFVISLVAFAISLVWASTAVAQLTKVPRGPVRPPKFITQMGGFGAEEGKLQYPQKLAVTPDGLIVSADAGNNRIDIFDPTGKFVRSHGTYGEAPGQFFHPGGVGVDPNGNFYVADFQEARIQSLDPTGKFIKARKASAALVMCPQGGQTFIFAADKMDHRIRKMTTDLETVKLFGSFGKGPGQMQFPSGLGCGRGAVFVTDMVGQRVQIFDMDGKFLRGFGTFGQGPGQFHNPYDVNVDQAGNIYVVDMSNHRVQVFNNGGKFLTAFGGYGEGPGQMKYPTGVAVDKKGFIYISDGGNHRIQKFTPLDQSRTKQY